MEFGVFLKFSIGIGTCPALTPSQVNACWGKGGSLLGKRSILNSCFPQSLSELHTSILLLLVYCFTLRQEVTEGISLRPNPAWLHIATDVWIPPFCRAQHFPGLDPQKASKEECLLGLPLWEDYSLNQMTCLEEKLADAAVFHLWKIPYAP